jgi:hypothetical protein
MCIPRLQNEAVAAALELDHQPQPNAPAPGVTVTEPAEPVAQEVLRHG